MNHLLITGILLLTLGFGLWRKPWRKEFFLAGRRAGTGQVAGSIIATCLGGSAVFGIVGKASEIGWSAFWWLGSGSVGILLLALFWLKSMRQTPASITLPQWLDDSYGRPARLLAATLIAIMWTGVISAQWVAAGALLNSLAGWPFAFGVIAAAMVTILYTCLGGQFSVLRTDAIQALIILLTLLLLLSILLLTVRPQTIMNTLAGVFPNPDQTRQVLSMPQWFSLVIVVGGMYLVGPDLYSRVALARDHASARRGALFAAAGLLICAFILTFLGVFIQQSDFTIGPEANALPWLIQALLPVGPAMIVQVTLLAVLLSSADTCLLTAATVLQLDLFQPVRGKRSESVARARLSIVMIGLVSVLLAILSPRIIGNIMLAYAVYAGGLMIPLLILRYDWAGRLPRGWVWSAMVIGGLLPLIGLLGNWFTAPDPMLRQATAGMFGILASSMLCILGWLLGRPWSARPDK